MILFCKETKKDLNILGLICVASLTTLILSPIILTKTKPKQNDLNRKEGKDQKKKFEQQSTKLKTDQENKSKDTQPENQINSNNTEEILNKSEETYHQPNSVKKKYVSKDKSRINLKSINYKKDFFNESVQTKEKTKENYLSEENYLELRKKTMYIEDHKIEDINVSIRECNGEQKIWAYLTEKYQDESIRSLAQWTEHCPKEEENILELRRKKSEITSKFFGRKKDEWKENLQVFLTKNEENCIVKCQKNVVQFEQEFIDEFIKDLNEMEEISRQLSSIKLIDYRKAKFFKIFCQSSNKEDLELQNGHFNKTKLTLKRHFFIYLIIKYINTILWKVKILAKCFRISNKENPVYKFYKECNKDFKKQIDEVIAIALQEKEDISQEDYQAARLSLETESKVLTDKH